MKSIFSFLLALQAVSALPLIERQIQAASIAGSWIAELSENANLTATLEEVQRVAGVKAKSSFSIGGFQGFAFDGDDSTLDALQDVESLKKIESEYIVETTVPVGELQSRALVRQSSSTWGLSRISSRSRGQSGYIYDNTAGQGTFVYILDTGVFTQHNDFGGRAVTGANFISGESSSDGNGHGTHCAGTVGGTVYGAAKGTTIIGVKVLSNSGSSSSSSVLQGIEWAINDAQRRGVGRCVFSMSLGGPRSQISNDAVAAAVRAGVFVAVAAGNENQNAANVSPASEPSACTVGATDINDNRSSFSNFGSSLDIFAPGTNVQSAWIGSTSATRTISGTSMACPHVAGLAAYLIALEGQRSPAALCQRIQSLSTRNAISGAGSGSPNFLAYNGNGQR